MKGIRLIFAACLAPLAFHGAIADDVGDATRAATRRTSAATVVSSNRQKSTSLSAAPATGTSRATNSNSKTAPSAPRTVGARTGNVVPSTGRGTTDTDSQSVTARQAANVQSRTTTTRTMSPARAAVSSGTQTRAGMARTAVSAATRTGALSRAATPNTSRAATTAAVRRPVNGTNISRAAVTADEIMGRDYKKCREVYYNCMDEFCANKDSQLKRCACSSRVNEFDNAKKQLSQIDDKMLDFNQRLLTVNMDKEDAAALFKATEGELAFNQKDTSDSKKMLDEIAKKLNTSFDSSNFDQNLSALSWSLNMDAAFDSVDSLLGASTTSKTGTDLYAAALPVCREMALEVCTEDELAIATSGYQMAIEQDCNTVAKSYATQTDTAREKVRESAALLDMSRLNIYQKRNSDDILTCKKKMLDKLTDSTVCGDKLGKCLDTSGRYIDPSTGEAFLTVNLADLNNLITRPAAGQTWTNAPGNEKFITYLNSKKKYLEPAMENCQDISDYVWNEFIEDALAQIKLAQDSKLEEVRQSCTTLTTQCLSNTADSLADFDARALSTFGVAADKTVNAMCAEVRNACTALLNTTGGGDDWQSGMTEIANDKTYETIMQTCREIGRACIIQACKSVSGNFGLCEDIQTSVNRKAIINRTSCWKEVQECVASAGAENIDGIMNQLADNGYLNRENRTFYATMYGDNNLELTNKIQKAQVAELDDEEQPEQPTTAIACELRPLTSQNENGEITATHTYNCVYDICENECGLQENGIYGTNTSAECNICRLTEKIWGNCEVHQASDLSKSGSHNRIRKPIGNQTTLMHWFATNTGTDQMNDSCRDTSCGIGYEPTFDGSGNKICVSSAYKVNGEMCLAPLKNITVSTVSPSLQNCCNFDNQPGDAAYIDASGNCCQGMLQDNPLNTIMFGTKTIDISQACFPVGTDDKFKIVASYSTDTNATYVICLGETLVSTNKTPGYPNGKSINCKGKYIFLTADWSTNLYRKNYYYEPPYNTSITEKVDGSETSGKTPVMFYNPSNQPEEQCKYSLSEGNVSQTWPTNKGNCKIVRPQYWQIRYE